MTYVLDAFALMAHFKKEPGATRMAELLEQATRNQQPLIISAVNLGEVFYKTVRQFDRRRAEEVLSGVQQLPILVVNVDRQLALDAALIKGAFRISYADCIAAALTQRLDATLITGDQGFGQVPSLKVEWLTA